MEKKPFSMKPLAMLYIRVSTISGNGAGHVDCAYLCNVTVRARAITMTSNIKREIMNVGYTVRAN